ncbi:MAG: cob(I)yrinic acid a,c-diamide adenosyltransferase [Elusimicrobiota bacterium]
MKSNKGYTHIYTGKGKGKTTASVGLALRARSHDWQVLYNYFFKQKLKAGGEAELLSRTGVKIEYFAQSRLGEIKERTEILKKEIINGLNYISRNTGREAYDLVILDEILIALNYNIISENILLEFLEKNSGTVELVLTGRGATSKIIKKADLVSEIKCVKHPYSDGVTARKGIEI